MVPQGSLYMPVPILWYGMVTINGETGDAVNGAVVDAYINSEKVASTIVGERESGYYVIPVPNIFPVPDYPEGTVVFFKVNDRDINEGPQPWVGTSNYLDISVEAPKFPYWILLGIPLLILFLKKKKI